MAFLLDVLFALLVDTAVGLFTALLNIPITLLTDALSQLFTPAT